MDDKKRDLAVPERDPQKDIIPNNFRPITCLPMMRKILTARIREEIYNLLISHRLFSKEQKGCCRGTRGRRQLLYIDQLIPKKTKTRQKNVATAWIDYKRAYNMVLKKIRCLKMYKISDEVIKFIEKSTGNWRVELTTGGKSFAGAKIQRGIFQRDALLLFVA